MATLPSPIVAFYNGVSFPPSMTETVDLSIRPQLDGSKRSVAFCLYSITLKSVLGDINQATGTSTDATVTSLRRLLTAIGAEFHYENVGAGNLRINIPPAGPTVGGAGPARDVCWGPVPRLLKYVPKGPDSCEVIWTVDVAIPECDNASYAFEMMEFVYRWSVDIDRSAYSTRRHSGYVRIPQTRLTVDARSLTDQADRLREQINPPLVPGFRRVPGRFELSADKCTLSFEIQDEEVGPNYPPPGVIDVQASHTVTSSNNAGIQWVCQIDATYEVERATPRSVTANHFLALCADRLQQAAAVAFPGKKGPERGIWIPRGLSFAEPEIYGRKGARYVLTYHLICGVKEYLKASGMWRPVPGSNWARWATSLQNSAFNCRGNARLRFDVTSDVLIDLCLPQPLALKPGTVPPQPPPISLRTGERPPKPVSWLLYVCWLRLEEISEVIELKPLPLESRTLSGGLTLGTRKERSLSTLPPDDGSNLTRTLPPAPPAPPLPSGPIVQRRAAPTIIAYLEGHALRAGHPVQVPELLSVGGADVVAQNREGNGVAHGQVADWAGVPIYGASWSKRYLVLGVPRGIEVPDNPMRGDL